MTNELTLQEMQVQLNELKELVTENKVANYKYKMMVCQQLEKYNVDNYRFSRLVCDQLNKFNEQIEKTKQKGETT